jgi:hypothetical protein
LNGKNEDGIKVELKADNDQIAEQFSAWMDFWSQGNHDDRTLAIVFPPLTLQIYMLKNELEAKVVT